MLTLQAGESSLVVAPEIGGAIVGWTQGAVPLLRLPHPDAIITGNVRGLACFTLVPFSNRIAYGKFHWGGAEYQLDRNFGDHPHTIHGVGWQSRWSVLATGGSHVTLGLRHDAIGTSARRWPFAFAAEQRLVLTPDALHVELMVRNLHGGPAPAGLGLHPHFPRRDAPRLTFRADAVWLNGPDMLPEQRVAIPPEWDHATGRPIGDASLDNCFTGWDGEARITHASSTPALTLTANPIFRHLVVYTPPGRDYFCVEPVSHMSDAINRMGDASDNGLRILAPGEMLRGEVSFTHTTIG